MHLTRLLNLYFRLKCLYTSIYLAIWVIRLLWQHTLSTFGTNYYASAYLELSFWYILNIHYFAIMKHISMHLSISITLHNTSFAYRWQDSLATYIQYHFWSNLLCFIMPRPIVLRLSIPYLAIMKHIINALMHIHLHTICLRTLFLLFSSILFSPRVST